MIEVVVTVGDSWDGKALVLSPPPVCQCLSFFLLVKYLSYCTANSVKTLKVVLEYWLLNEYCHVVSYYRHFKHLHVISCLHCIDAGGYALGRASGLLKNSLLVGWQLWFDRSWVHFYMFNGFSFCHYCCHIHRLLLQYVEKCTFRYCPTGCLGMLAVKQGIVCVCVHSCVLHPRLSLALLLVRSRAKLLVLDIYAQS